MSRFFVYIVECSDGSLYTGIARDVARRVQEHNEAKIGARYTKTRRPVTLRYSERKKDRSAALVREAALKKLTRAEKLALLTRGRATIRGLPVLTTAMGKGDNRQRKEKKKPKQDKNKKK